MTQQATGQQSPSPDDTSRKPFIIGLTLAGAVSAGAYSGGVLDFLFQALGEWQAAKDRRDPGVPQHEVQIAAVSGASAGGITGAISLLSLAAGLRPGLETPTASAELPPGGEPAKGIPRVLPELFDAWVTGPRLFGDAAGAKNGSFLDPTDIKVGGGFASLLDSGPLQQVAERVLGNIKPCGRKYPFLTDPVHLFLTVTNLDGIPYVMPFQGGSYAMTNHADCVHYAMKGIGAVPYPIERCQWLGSWGDTGIEINLSKSLAPAEPAGRAFIQSVLATSAFPFALRSRELIRPSSVFVDRAWQIEEADRHIMRVYPAWTLSPTPIKEFTTFCVAVDGGATDNQPFEYAHWSIRDMNLPRNPQEREKADRAVIMIDPFGAPRPYDLSDISASRRDDLVLTHVLKTFVPALTNQARFKISDLMHANDPETYSRFLISPARFVDKQRVTPALASGLLEAFGGFLDQRFREHDFQLGRRNCQKFLMTHFVLDKTNNIFCKNDGWQAPPDAEDPNLRPVIPLVGTALPDIPEIAWPKIEAARLGDFEKAMATRLDSVALKLINETVPNAAFNLVARFIWRRFKREMIVTYIRDVVATTLLRSGQIVVTGADGKPLPATPEQYAVIAALTDPAYDMRTSAGIAAEYKMLAGMDILPPTTGGRPFDEPQVESAIKSLGSLVVRHSRGRGKPKGYTLKSRQPSLASPWTSWLRINRHFRYDDAKAAAAAILAPPTPSASAASAHGNQPASA